MAIIGRFEKQPDEVLDYDIDFAEWIPDGDVVSSATITSSPAGLTVGTVGVFGSYLKVWISEGVDGTTYKLEVTATTQGGRVKQAEFLMKVREV